jgi:hypothetical protein
MTTHNATHVNPKLVELYSQQGCSQDIALKKAREAVESLAMHEQREVLARSAVAQIRNLTNSVVPQGAGTAYSGVWKNRRAVLNALGSLDEINDKRLTVDLDELRGMLRPQADIHEIRGLTSIIQGAMLTQSVAAIQLPALMSILGIRRLPYTTISKDQSEVMHGEWLDAQLLHDSLATVPK